MVQNLDHELHYKLVRERPGRIDYARKAFKMLPKLDSPEILDIGCGPGEPTIELAKMSGGHVTGIDIKHSDLDELERKAKEQNLSERIKVLNMSMTNMNFPDQTFDIIWSEGSIFVIGFKRGLREWKRFIKPDGFLVVHDMCWINPNPPQEIQTHWKGMYPGITTVENSLEIVSKCGYKIIGHFPLPESAWWDIYFGPLEERVDKLRLKYKDDSHAKSIFDKEQREIDLYKKYQRWYGSAYFIMQK
jgi:SAM-dependent methyltransferase